MKQKRQAVVVAAILGASALSAVGSLGANVTFLCDGYPATVIGTEDHDVLRGTPGDDVIVGLGGNDRIRGFGGDDIICAGEGDDVVAAGPGADLVLGGMGDDTINGHRGADELSGGDGQDTIFGNQGKDVILGGGEADTLRGNNGADRVEGGRGADLIYGNRGGDLLRGGSGDDVIIGGAQLDDLRGENGDDVLRGATLGALSEVADVYDGGDGIDQIEGVTDQVDRPTTSTEFPPPPEVPVLPVPATTLVPDEALDALQPPFSLVGFECTQASLTDGVVKIWDGLTGDFSDRDLHLAIVNRVREVCDRAPLAAAWRDAEPATFAYAPMIADARERCVDAHGEDACHWSTELSQQTWWFHSGIEHFEGLPDNALTNDQFSLTGENIALQPNARVERFLDAWINSDGHFCNMIHPGWDQVQISTAEHGKWRFAVHNFRGESDADFRGHDFFCLDPRFQ